VTLSPLAFPYDPDTWVDVPLDHLDGRWSDAASWAQWLADEATRGRPDAAELRDIIAEQALAVATFPAEHVSARFWHYPVDGSPSGFVDLFVQARARDESTIADLLPDPGFTVVTPVTADVGGTLFDEAVRRLTIAAVLPSEDAPPVAVPRAEWIGVRGEWVCYAVSRDHDAQALAARLEDIDDLFRAVDVSAVPA
jgi:hypothetical protein